MCGTCLPTNYLTLPSRLEAFSAAEAAGLKVDQPGAFDIQVDIDSPTLPADFAERVKMATELGLVVDGSVDIRPSKSGNLHVTLRSTEYLSGDERILLQALLGSDWKREMLGYKRWLNGDDAPTVLFRPTPPNGDEYKTA